MYRPLFTVQGWVGWGWGSLLGSLSREVSIQGSLSEGSLSEGSLSEGSLSGGLYPGLCPGGLCHGDSWTENPHGRNIGPETETSEGTWHQRQRHPQKEHRTSSQTGSDIIQIAPSPPSPCEEND